MTARTLGLPLDRERGLIPQLRAAHPGQLAVAVAASVLGGCILAATGDWVAFALVAIAFLLGLGALRPALFLLLLVLVRPLLDLVSGDTVGLRSANVGGAVAIALILVTAFTAVRRRRMYWPAAAPAMLIALAVTAVSAIQAELNLGAAAGEDALAEVVRVAALLAAYVLAANVAGTERRARRLFLIVGLSGVVPALLGIAEWISGPPVVEELGVPRISGPFTGPVAFGLFLGATGLIVMFLPREQLRPSFRAAALLPILVALVGSLSRQGWFLFAAGVLLVGWRGRKLLPLGVAVALAALIIFVPTVRERALPASTPTAMTSSGGSTYSSWTWRTENWGGLLERWSEKPVFGHGLRTTPYVNQRAPFGIRRTEGSGFDAHNLGVRLLVEGGVVLLAAYALFFAMLLRSAWRLARTAWPLRALGRLLLAIWTLVVLVALTADDPFAGTALMLSLLALTGSLDAAYRSRHPAARSRPALASADTWAAR